MDKKSREFVEQCMKSNTTVSVFIKLFNLWDELSVEQRGDVIDNEISKGRLRIKL